MERIKTTSAGGEPRDRYSTFAWRWYFGNVAALILLVLVPVWLKTALHRFHNYDLGIFAQALHSIRLGDLNPFLPALNIPIFNDHFDPILIVFAPLARIMEPAYAALTIEHMLVILSPLPILLLCRKEVRHLPYVCFAVTYLLFNRGTISALNFPVHPTTWASLFIVLLAVSIAGRRYGLLLFASVCLMACKEEFPFVVAMIGACFLLKRQFKIGSAMLVLAIAWCAVAFGLRPMLVGETHHYGSRILMPIMTDPVTTLGTCFSDLKGLKRLLQCCLPFLPLIIWGIRNRVSPDWLLLSGVIPMLAIRFLDGAWAFHYMAPVAALFVAAAWRKDQPGLPVRYAVAGAVIVILTSIGPISKTVSIYGSVQDLSSMRMKAIDDARSQLIREADGKALVEGNLSPLLAKRPGVFQIGGVQPPQEYRYLFTEKPPSGDPWPLKHSDIVKIIDEWRNRPSSVVIRDDEFIFFAEKKMSANQ